jgi:excisionase family DNA binding protein
LEILEISFFRYRFLLLDYPNYCTPLATIGCPCCGLLMVKTADLTVDELAQLLRCHKTSVLRWIAGGRIDAFRLPGGGGYRISAIEVERIRQPIIHRGPCGN